MLTKRHVGLLVAGIVIATGVVPSALPTLTVSAAAYTGGFNFSVDGATVTGCATSCNGMSLTIPSDNGSGVTVTSIGNSAFYANMLTSVIIPSSVTSIGNSAFATNKLTSVTIPSSVTSIGSEAFATNMLTSVTIPSSVTSIGVSAFLNNALTSVTLPSSVTSIGNSAFENNALTLVTLGSSLLNIGANAFRANALTSVTIPSSVTSIGSSAFADNGLKSIAFLGNRPTISNGAFIYSLQCVYYAAGKTGWPGTAISGVIPSLETGCTVAGAPATTAPETSATTAPTTTTATSASATPSTSATKTTKVGYFTFRSLTPRQIAINAGLNLFRKSKISLKVLTSSKSVCKLTKGLVKGTGSGMCRIAVAVTTPKIGTSHGMLAVKFTK